MACVMLYRMVILPAIDIKNRTPVRLIQGDFSTSHKVAENPLETALSFQEAGAEWIHMVDLDGAVQGERVNSDIFLAVVQQTTLKVELGGGIRRMEDIVYCVEAGISRVILGSAALQSPELVREAVSRYGDKIAVGIDARDGKVAADGWLKTSAVRDLDLAKRMEAMGVQTLIYTDISKDGTLSGPNLKALAALKEAVSCHIIASGGISNITDIQHLMDLDLYGAICGKSIYSGSLDIAEAIALCQNED